MELTTFAFNTVALAFILVAVYDFLAPIYCTATNRVVSLQQWAIAFADIQEEEIDVEVNPYLDLPLEEIFILSDKIGNKYLEADNHYIATLDWIQPIENIGEYLIDQYLEIDIIGLAKFQSLRLTKHYKLHGEDVVRVEDIRFPVADFIRRYKLRGMEVIKLSALSA